MQVGENVLIAGLAIQCFSLVVFLTVLWKFWELARREQRIDAENGWRRVVRAVAISCVLILVSLISPFFTPQYFPSRSKIPDPRLRLSFLDTN